MKNILFLLSLALPSITFGAEMPQTVDFRHFLYKFFNDAEYQKEHIKFPYAYAHFSSEEEDTKLINESIGSDLWKYMKGSDHYRCKKSCFDLVIYDNFKHKHKESGERVLSFEGVENGINEVLYFKLLKSEWYMVKHESLSN